ncbi:hypothetical protein M427DRAFT_45199 [Gonapodya prolifera JEL478]|uniref:Uncharacterized protein n=1 Tax=Gonapodya prolifera (strain JEL478) TaxID=1344416 RepID=A0A139ABG3_GONPJ|nr:hypothetical protein M427DRAFT_45199 [Gonapodya prolifera JEL478]|eukprot:KXS14100.1 hypothetical protein M427DRAFT_45199 [Gonapodya prolifera JEL478]
MAATASPSTRITFPPKPLLTWAIDSFDRLLVPFIDGIVPYSGLIEKALSQAEALSTPEDPWPVVLGGVAAHECYLNVIQYLMSIVRWDNHTASGRIITLANFLQGPLAARKKLQEALEADPNVLFVELKPVVFISPRRRGGAYGVSRVKSPTEENGEEAQLLASRAVTYEYSDFVQDPEGYVKRLIEVHPGVLGTDPNGVGMSWSQSCSDGVQAVP